MSKYLLTNEDYDNQMQQKLFNEFLAFKDIFFTQGVSYFDNNLKLFDNNEVFTEYEKRIISNYDASDKGSIDKYKIQLSSSSKKFRHFFANLIWLYNFPIHGQGKLTKIEEVKTYLGDYYNKDLVDNHFFNDGIASYGMLNMQKYFNINFLFFFTKQYRQNPSNPNEIINNINVSDLMKKLSNEKFDNVHSLASRHMLNYLFNPDFYEPIVNTSCKEAIVKHFLNKINKSTLDKDIYKIRKETFGFDNSLYHICEGTELNTTKIARVITKPFEKKYFDNIVDTNSKNYEDNDPLEIAKQKIKNGLLAEELVYINILKKVDKILLTNRISKIYNLQITTVMQDIDKLIHYSKHYDKYAPFDLLSTKNNDILYIEVKSTISDEIYFSKNEIIFAYEHIDKYQVKIVKNDKIFDIDMNDIIQDIYKNILSNNDKWSIETIKFKIEFL